MVSSIAKRIFAMTNRPVAILGADGKPRMSEMWAGLEYINASMASYAASFILNGPSYRQYYRGMDGNRIVWRKWDIAPGEIRLTDAERDWAECETRDFGNFIVVETRYKGQGGGGVNKLWPYWTEFFADPPAVKIYPMKDAPTFRHACAILGRSIGYVGHEGGLHHAAAALGKPAVVIFGGYISPEVTGYPSHANLYVPHPNYPLGCGSVTRCDHCRDAMSKITVEEVVRATKEMVNAMSMSAAG